MGKIGLTKRIIVNLFIMSLISSVTFLLLQGCAHQKAHVSVSQYRFDYNDINYRIRSIKTNNHLESYNELIGDKFVAVDYDQDRIIDCVLIGDVNLAEIQLIYEYGLHKIKSENKLSERMPQINRFVESTNKVQMEISSFRPARTKPFNQFKIVDKHELVNPIINVTIDRNADGTLDEVLKGEVNLEKIQAEYSKLIESGLKKQKLIKQDGSILVKGN